MTGTWVGSADESTVGNDVPAATMELHADNSLAVKDFPLGQPFRGKAEKLGYLILLDVGVLISAG
ncbi:hypothetical protein [Arthrobacter sp. ISL-95]|uniref:hypothetical protein n=1 Tax=Arthrobacter sp. ISL-95 TaxID=2819116 RepID=UPI001BEA8D10|nr:hypothetical protein [Arthrobacter sp. ISL-95]MBT2585653.1 hypothetical protein [Arthrobacter sp. ISL-95]